jgi:serine/threonine-protein kinase
LGLFGRYEILDKLGEGAMGVVYRARDEGLGRVIALKMLSTELGDEEELHQRFHREAEAIGRLSHPNIVSVFDMGDVSGRLYMAMELLEGEDLRSLIAARAPVSLAEKVRIMAEICDGVGYAHTRGVVHRDIKPANIVVTSTGRVKLLDFGLARVPAGETITQRGVILGTPDYMSPEQATGRGVDHRTDVFSSGAVFYELLTMQKPFKGKTLHSVLYQIISEEPEAVLTLNAEVPGRLAATVHAMLRKDAARRPPSMEAVGREIHDIHASLRRSASRSALPGTDAPASDDARGRFRDHVAKSRAHLEEGRFSRAADEARQALSLDPESDEAAELAWQSERRVRSAVKEPRPDAAAEARVAALLERAAPGHPEPDARRAIAELALIAPDDPRVGEVIRERAARP